MRERATARGHSARRVGLRGPDDRRLRRGPQHGSVAHQRARFEPWPGVVYGSPAVTPALAVGPATMADVDTRARLSAHAVRLRRPRPRRLRPRQEAIDRAGHARESRDGSRRPGSPCFATTASCRSTPPARLDRRDRSGGLRVHRPAAARRRSSRTRSPRRSRRSSVMRRAGVEVAGDDGSDPARAAELGALCRRRRSSSPAPTRPRGSIACACRSSARRCSATRMP